MSSDVMTGDTLSSASTPSMVSVMPAVATTLGIENKTPGSKCNLKVMSIEEFNKLSESLIDMARVNLLDAVEATSTSPDCINVRWRPNVKLAPHIAAYKVRYSEITEIQLQQQQQQQLQASSLSTVTQTPFTAYTEQEYVSEFLSSNSREYSIARLSPATRYTVCVSAYPSSIEYWAKFGDNMKKCVDLETKPPPDVIAWLVLGMMALLLVMVLILAAVVVHRRRTQARQNRSLRLATSPADYDTPVVLVAAGPQSSATLTKQIPPFASSNNPNNGGNINADQHQRLLQQQQQQQQLVASGQPPPAYSTTPRNAKLGIGQIMAVVNNSCSNSSNSTTADSSPIILAPLASMGDDESKNDPNSNGNDEPVRQPIFLAAVNTTRSKQSSRPPLAHFTSRSCAGHHQSSSHHHHPHNLQSQPITATLLPSHNDATTDLSTPSLYRNGNGSIRSGNGGQYQHLLFSNKKAGSQPLTYVPDDGDISASTSGVFGEELASLLNSSGLNNNLNSSSAAIIMNNISCSLESDLATSSNNSNSQQPLPDILTAKINGNHTSDPAALSAVSNSIMAMMKKQLQDDTKDSNGKTNKNGGIRNNGSNGRMGSAGYNNHKQHHQGSLRKQSRVEASTPPPPPPYEGVAALCANGRANTNGNISDSVSSSNNCNSSSDTSLSHNSHDDVEIDIQADTDGLICVI